jgi:uncharacterized membrane protein
MLTHVALWTGRGIDMWGDGLAFRWFAMLLFLGFLVLIAVGVAFLWRRGVGPGPGPGSRPDDALATIRMRYAKGEMTREEFIQANADLGGSQPPPSE